MLYVESARDETRWTGGRRRARPAALAEHTAAGGEGAGARAVSTRGVVSSEPAGLRVRTLAGE